MISTVITQLNFPKAWSLSNDFFHLENSFYTYNHIWSLDFCAYLCNMYVLETFKTKNEKTTLYNNSILKIKSANIIHVGNCVAVRNVP